MSIVTSENNDEGEESLNIFSETNDEGEDSLIKLSETNDEGEDSLNIFSYPTISYVSLYDDAFVKVCSNVPKDV